MDLQLIFVVETDSKTKSDWIYIKDTIDYFYNYDEYHVKFSPVYMAGKGNYKKVEGKILKLISDYAAVNNQRQSKVIYCFDCDDFDTNRVDMDFLESAKEYCDEKQYDFIWFCKDVERVYLGRKVAEKQKAKEAAKFKSGKLIKKVNKTTLEISRYTANTSNILRVIDKYLERKCF